MRRDRGARCRRAHDLAGLDLSMGPHPSLVLLLITAQRTRSLLPHEAAIARPAREGNRREQRTLRYSSANCRQYRQRDRARRKRFRLPWRRAAGGIMRPINVASKMAYRGVNVVALWASDSSAPTLPSLCSNCTRKSLLSSRMSTCRARWKGLNLPTMFAVDGRRLQSSLLRAYKANRGELACWCTLTPKTV